MHRHRPLTIFKFQSDSINTAERKKKVRINNHFKFQSDSINTELTFAEEEEQIPLNSNLILLIRNTRNWKRPQWSALNSNLILLIRTEDIR